MNRAFWVRLHRWAGLTMAGFLILVGLTGSMLAFIPELNHWLTPKLYPSPHGVELDAATLARSAEALVPQGRPVSVFFFGYASTARVKVEARPGAPPLNFDQLFLDSVTGEELGRSQEGGLPDALSSILPFVYRLHWSLAMGQVGEWILGIVALVWTIDCFVAFYLTLPGRGAHTSKGYMARWKPAWLVKWRASFYRVNFDLHRAGGLWLSAILLIFAWSGVCFDLNGFYRQATKVFFDLETPVWLQQKPPPPPEGKQLIGWEEAQAIAMNLMSKQAAAQGFRVDRPVSFSIMRERGLYNYYVHSSRDIGEKYGSTSIYIDAYTGALRGMHIPTRQHSGDTLTTWLVELHMANVFGLPYRVFVCALGLAIVMLSGTGVYIWWKKRRARKLAATRACALEQQEAPAEVPAE
jgi:uncharacterized iron-regulated membrane protein